ncbi:MAG: TetR family transcriptional regulator [Piscirickettsiaceae bacterium]|nr:MAG: TetR family transcriptional regulator [Piscirickettsiaceae bacterium]
MEKLKTAEKILQGATRLFAQHGYDGTIMDELAEQCAVNKASIYYHHKDKETLYEHCLAALFTPIADTVITAVAEETEPLQKLRTHIQTFAHASAANPYFSAILMREMAAGGTNLPVVAREQMQRILASLKQTLAAGEDAHVFKKTEPLIIHFMIIGTINLFVATLPLRKALAEEEGRSSLKISNINPVGEQLAQTIIHSLLRERDIA